MAPGAVHVREGEPDDLVATMNVVDGAGLAVDVDRVRERLAAGDVLLAVAGGGEPGERERVLGALVLDPAGPPWEEGAAGDETADPEAADATDTDADATDTDANAAEPEAADAAHLVAVAVRRRRRDRGLGTALVEAAGERVADGERVATGERAGRLTAAFRADVRPFYESLGFAVTGETADGRLRGVRDGG